MRAMTIGMVAALLVVVLLGITVPGSANAQQGRDRQEQRQQELRRDERRATTTTSTTSTASTTRRTASSTRPTTTTSTTPLTFADAFRRFRDFLLGTSTTSTTATTTATVATTATSTAAEGDDPSAEEKEPFVSYDDLVRDRPLLYLARIIPDDAYGQEGLSRDDAAALLGTSGALGLCGALLLGKGRKPDDPPRP